MHRQRIFKSLASFRRYHIPQHPHDLGLRTERPPDSSAKPQLPKTTFISDHDWELRTGRAIYILRQTLPEFFVLGLVTSMDGTTGASRRTGIGIGEGLGDGMGIYETRIGLRYTPPVALPPPFPATLHVEGLPLYLASAVFIRHTLNALYTDLKLELRKCVVETPRPTGSGGIHAQTPTPTPTTPTMQKKGREKSLVVRFGVTGISRVSGGLGEWEVTSTYTFSPHTGRIENHIIDSIFPAPHYVVYDSIRMSLGKVFGQGQGQGQGV